MFTRWMLIVSILAGCAHDAANEAPDAGSGAEFGAAQPMTSASEGLAAQDYDTLVGASAAGGSLGCTIVQNETAAPGTATALVYAKVRKGEAGDTRCPSGNYAIVNNPMSCGASFTGLAPGCVLYKRWDGSGTLVANRFAIGGYVTIQDVTRGEYDHACNIDVSATFTGGVTIRSTFSYDYDPYSSQSAFCMH